MGACDVLRPTGTEDSQLRGAAQCPDGAGAVGPGATVDFPSALTGRSGATAVVAPRRR